MTGIELLLSTLAAAALPTPQDIELELGSMWGTAGREREAYRVVRLPIPEHIVLEVRRVCDPSRRTHRRRHPARRCVLRQRCGRPEARAPLRAVRDRAGRDLRPRLRRRRADRDAELRGHAHVRHRWRWARGSLRHARRRLRLRELPRVRVRLAARRERAAPTSRSASRTPTSRTSCFAAGSWRSRADGRTQPYASGLRSPAGIGLRTSTGSSASSRARDRGTRRAASRSSSAAVSSATRRASCGTPRAGARSAPERAAFGHARPRRGRPYPGARALRRRSSPTSAWGARSRPSLSTAPTAASAPSRGSSSWATSASRSLVRATMEEVDGVWQGACYPFREGLSTGILDVHFTPGGSLLAGGTNRGWPVRGTAPFALERIEWTGHTPFEVERITIEHDGFVVRFTDAMDAVTGADPASYSRDDVHAHLPRGYGGPEVDRTSSPNVLAVDPAAADLTFCAPATRRREAWTRARVRPRRRCVRRAVSRSSTRTPTTRSTRCRNAPHPVAEDPRWLRFVGGEGPGAGKSRRPRCCRPGVPQRKLDADARAPACRAPRVSHDRALRAERPSGTRRSDAEDPVGGQVGPATTSPASRRSIRLTSSCSSAASMTLPEEQRRAFLFLPRLGKPLIGLRTANHGFIGFDYELEGRRINFGEDVLGGSFRGHHGRWHQDSTRGSSSPRTRATRSCGE
jgi:hypothetical protein